MANIIKLKRGLSSAINGLTLEDGEIAIVTDTNQIYTNKGVISSSVKTLSIQKNNLTTDFDGTVTKTIIIPTVHYGSSAPSNSLGQDGDIYMVMAPTTINFIIGAETFIADEGMTWRQWIDSDYNTIDAFINEYSDGERVEYIDGSNGRYICEYRSPSEKFVYADETIIANYDYDDSYKYPIAP